MDKKVQKIVKDNKRYPIKSNEKFFVEKKPYDFWWVRTISEPTNKPVDRNNNTYEGNWYNCIQWFHIRHSIWM